MTGWVLQMFAVLIYLSHTTEITPLKKNNMWVLNQIFILSVCSFWFHDR